MGKCTVVFLHTMDKASSTAVVSLLDSTCSRQCCKDADGNVKARHGSLSTVIRMAMGS